MSLQKLVRRFLIAFLYFASAGAIVGIYGLAASAITGASQFSAPHSALATQIEQIAGQSFEYIGMVSRDGENLTLNLTNNTYYLVIGEGKETFVGVIDPDGYVIPYQGQDMLQSNVNPHPLPPGLIKKEDGTILVQSDALRADYIKVYKYFQDYFAKNLSEGEELTLYVLKNNSIKTITIKTEGYYSAPLNGTQNATGWAPATVISDIQPDLIDTCVGNGAWDAQVEYNIGFADLTIYINNTRRLEFRNTPVIGLSTGGSASTPPASLPQDFNETLEDIEATVVRIIGVGLAMLIMFKGVREIGMSL